MVRLPGMGFTVFSKMYDASAHFFTPPSDQWCMEAKTPSPSLLIDVIEVARLLSISERAVYAMVSNRKFLTPIKMGRISRWRRGDVEEWVRGLAA